MQFNIDDKTYDIVIIKKSNKNTYIRIDDELNIVVTTGLFTTKKMVADLIKKNEKAIIRMLNQKEKEVNKKDKFYYLGKEYQLILTNLDEINFDGDYLYANSKKFNSWYKKQMQTLFSERLKYNYDLFEEKIPFPSLRIRTMKTRWGVCNIKTKTVTLNSLLLRYEIDKIDYVIIHELSHLIYANHSKDFWKLVSKYCPKYKEMRKALKE